MGPRATQKVARRLPASTAGRRTPTGSANLALATLPEGLAELSLEDLAGACARKLGHEGHRARDLVSGQVLLGEGDDVGLAERSFGLHDDHRVHALAPLLARDAEYGDVEDVGVDLQAGLDLGRIDVHPAGDDHVLLAVADVEVALFIAVG